MDYGLFSLLTLVDLGYSRMDCYLKTVADGSNIFQVFYTLLLGICRRLVKTLETSLPFHLPFSSKEMDGP